MNNPRQAWQHNFEEISTSQLKETLASVGWRAQDIKHDYGEDLFGRQFKNGNPTGNAFYIQLKGTDHIEQYRLKNQQVLSYSIELKNLMQWYSFRLPVILILWDINNRMGYWLHIQPFIQRKVEINKNWRSNTKNAKEPKRKIQIPINQTIKIGDLDLLEKLLVREWKTINQGQKHFDILYKASEVQLGEDYQGELSPTIKRDIELTQAKAKVSCNSNNLIAWFDIAALNYENGNFKESYKAINKAWKINQEYPIIKQLKACILAEYAIENNNRSSMLHEAIKLFESSLEDGGILAEYNIANCYVALGNHQEAIIYFDKALQNNLSSKEVARIWHNRGQSMMKIGDIDSAEFSFTKALEYDESLWNIYSSLAHISIDKNDNPSACNYFDKLFQLNPELKNDGDSHLNCYARALFNVGRYNDAYEIIEQFLLVNPFDESGIVLKGYTIANLRRQDTSFTKIAFKFFENRLLDEPSDMLARSELALIYQELGLEEKRRKLLKETVEFDNVPAKALYEYAILLENDGFIDESIYYLEKSLAIEENHPIHHFLAKLYRKKERYSDAIKHFNLALVDCCSLLPILSEISDCYYLMEDYKNDIVVLTKILLMGAKGHRFQQNLFFALEKEDIDYTDYYYFYLFLSSKEKILSEVEIRNELNIFLQKPHSYREYQYEFDSNDEQYIQWEKLRRQKLKEMGYEDSFNFNDKAEPHPSFDATDEEWGEWIKRTTDFEKIDADIQAGLLASLELERQTRAKTSKLPQSMSISERSKIIKDQLIKLREGWTDTLILSDLNNDLNYVEFTEIICEVPSKTSGNDKSLLTKQQTKELQSLGFDQPNSCNQSPNYSIEWNEIKIENMVEIVNKAFRIIGSLDNFSLVVEN